MRTQVQSLASLSGLRIQQCCELWYRLAAAAPIRLLAWEFLYAMGAALKIKKKKKKKEEEEERKKKTRTGHRIEGNIKIIGVPIVAQC